MQFFLSKYQTALMKCVDATLLTQKNANRRAWFKNKWIS